VLICRFLSILQDSSQLEAATPNEIRALIPVPFIHFTCALQYSPFLLFLLQAFNVLRYEIGQKYNSHYDYFATEEYGPQDSQRVSLFLSDNLAFSESVVDDVRSFTFDARAIVAISR
jgi:hypothetical protein